MILTFESDIFVLGDSSVTGGYRDFGTEADGYIDGILLNVTAETGELYYVSIYALNGAGIHFTIFYPPVSRYVVF